KRLLAYANSRIPGEIKARSIQVGWHQAVIVKDLALYDSSGEKIASLATLQVDSPLTHLLRKNGLKLNIEGLNAVLCCDENGTTNWERALGISPALKQQQQHNPSLALQDISGFIAFKNGLAAIQLSGKTLWNGEKGEFQIDADLQKMRALK